MLLRKAFALPYYFVCKELVFRGSVTPMLCGGETLWQDRRLFSFLFLCEAWTDLARISVLNLPIHIKETNKEKQKQT